jgi:hypothetical protein
LQESVALLFKTNAKDLQMGKLYLKNSSEEGKLKKLAPKEETIALLLNYSKALSVIDGKMRKYELLLN